MELFNGVRSSLNQDLIAPFEVGAPKVLQGEVHELKIGAGCPIKNHDPLAERGEIWVARGGQPGEGRSFFSHKEPGY
ncbi:unannotated protein [freshwater metagenome]|uniref:Unannotated protein n=1 Tax=freshwater metagenome TaxID=449393 RepID=A0A6J7APC0_9ZZZZ